MSPDSDRGRGLRYRLMDIPNAGKGAEPSERVYGVAGSGRSWITTLGGSVGLAELS